MKALKTAPLFLLLTGLIQAGTIFSTYTGSDNNLPVSIPYHLVGMGFTMPGTGSYSLDSVTIRLGYISLATPPVSFGLYADSSGTPTGTTPLATFTTPSLPAGNPANDYTLTPTASFTLAPSTTYWFVADGTSAAGYGISWIGSSTTVSSTGLASYGGYYDSFSKWGSSLTLNGAGTTFDITVLGTQQNGGGTPEPATMTLAGLALGAMALRLRRR